MRGTSSDPFAALDSKSPSMLVDEISSRFPSLDQFSLLHEGGKFDFEASSPPKAAPTRDISQRVTEKLADDAFAMPPAAQSSAPSAPANAAASAVSRAQKIISNNPDLQAVASPPTVVYQPTPTRPQASSYVSQGTMTTPLPPTSSLPSHYNPSPVHRFHKTADHHRSTSLPRNQESMPKAQQQYLHPEARSTPSATLHQRPTHTRHSSSSRPSLEGARPTADQLEPITRTKSSNSRARPASTYLESNMDFLREKESGGRSSMDMRRSTSKPGEMAVEDQSSDEDTNIASNVDFLRTMEETDSLKKDRRRRSSASHKHHTKRSSLPSLSGTKNLLAGKFGDAFKRFESNTNAGPRTPSPLSDLERRDLTPIAGSEATDGRSDDGYAIEDMDSMAPEQRREAERRRLSMEERRVANAAAEYRRRLAERGPSTAPKSIGGVSRAASIQNKVKNLLDENQQTSPKKTAEGYGRFTDPGPGSPLSPQKLDHSISSPAAINPYTTRPPVSRKPILPNPGSGPIHPRTIPLQSSDLSYPKPRPPPHSPQSAPPAISKPSTILPRPNAPPKPTHLNSVSTGGGPGPRSASPPKNALGQASGQTRRLEARPDMSAQEKEDYIKDFSKRFPSLSGIEMVETDIGRGERGREV
jgi:AP2-associated kinase